MAERKRTLSASGVNREKVINPGARYEIKFKDLIMSSQAVPLIGKEGEEEEEAEEEDDDDHDELEESVQAFHDFDMKEKDDKDKPTRQSLSIPPPSPPPPPPPSSSPPSPHPSLPPYPLLLQTSTFGASLLLLTVSMTKLPKKEDEGGKKEGKIKPYTYLLSDLQEPEHVSMRFSVASMEGVREKRVNALPPSLSPPSEERSASGAEAEGQQHQQQQQQQQQQKKKSKKPVVRITMEEVKGEERLVVLPRPTPPSSSNVEEAKEREIKEEEEEEGIESFAGLQFLSFPGMSVVMGKEDGDPSRTVIASLLHKITTAAAAAASSSSSSSSEVPVPPSVLPSSLSFPSSLSLLPRDHIVAHASKGYVRASTDLAMKGLMLADLQKRTQASMKKLAECLNGKKTVAGSTAPAVGAAAEARRVSGSGSGDGGGGGGERGGGEENSGGRRSSSRSSSSSSSSVLALTPLRQGMHMNLCVDVMQVEIVLANPPSFPPLSSSQMGGGREGGGRKVGSTWA